MNHGGTKKTTNCTNDVIHLKGERTISLDLMYDQLRISVVDHSF
jgi:hypothetical protein